MKTFNTGILLAIPDKGFDFSCPSTNYRLLIREGYNLYGATTLLGEAGWEFKFHNPAGADPKQKNGCEYWVFQRVND
jgi:hypothetical protein